jgi:hypothetical protein
MNCDGRCQVPNRPNVTQCEDRMRMGWTASDDDPPGGVHTARVLDALRVVTGKAARAEDHLKRAFARLFASFSATQTSHPSLQPSPSLILLRFSALPAIFWLLCTFSGSLFFLCFFSSFFSCLYHTRITQPPSMASVQHPSRYASFVVSVLPGIQAANRLENTD